MKPIHNIPEIGSPSPLVVIPHKVNDFNETNSQRIFKRCYLQFVVIPHKVNDFYETFISCWKTIHLTHHFFSIFVGREKIIELIVIFLIIKNQ